MFRPEFSDKYTLQVIIADNKENDVIEIIRANSKMGKIFISPITRAIDELLLPASLINFLYTRTHDTYFQSQNEKDISILLDRDLSLQTYYCLRNLYG